MKLKLKNNHIYYATAMVWGELDYRLKFLINALCAANPEPNVVQEIEIKAADFIKIMRTVNSQPQGVAKDINAEIYDLMYAQIMSIAAPVFKKITAAGKDVEAIEVIKTENAEVLTIAQAIQNITIENNTALENIIISGRAQIVE